MLRKIDCFWAFLVVSLYIALGFSLSTGLSTATALPRSDWILASLSLMAESVSLPLSEKEYAKSRLVVDVAS